MSKFKKSTNRRSRLPKAYYDHKQKMFIASVVSISLGAVLLASFYNSGFAIINYLTSGLFNWFGESAYIVPAILIGLGVLFYEMKEDYIDYSHHIVKNVIGYFLVFQASTILIENGIFGGQSSSLLSTLLGDTPSFIVLIISYALALSVGSHLIMINKIQNLVDRYNKSKNKVEVTVVEKKPKALETKKKIEKPSGYKLPGFELLNDRKTKVAKPNFSQVSGVIVDTLNELGLKVKNAAEAKYSSNITTYFIEKKSNMSIKNIESKKSDIEAALSTSNISFTTKTKSPNVIGIEVPNDERPILNVRDVLETNDFINSKNLEFVVGQENDETITFDMEKLPHLLVGGQTRSGKTVFIHNILLNLLMKNTPEDLQLILVDMAKTELVKYEGLPHLLTDVVDNYTDTNLVFNWLIGEMQRRLELLKDSKCQDIQSYNKKKDNKLPSIALFIDEYADLIANAPAKNDIELKISRIASMARKAGIHLIVATQHPNSKIITSVIKANLPGRAAFTVTDYRASQTIIDKPGAEMLNGNGEALIKSPLHNITRIQAPLVIEKDIEKVVAFCKKQKNHSVFNKGVLEPVEVEVLESQAIEADENRIENAVMFAKQAIIESRKIDVNKIHSMIKDKVMITRTELEDVVYPILEEGENALLEVRPHGAGTRRYLNISSL